MPLSNRGDECNGFGGVGVWCVGSDSIGGLDVLLDVRALLRLVFIRFLTPFSMHYYTSLALIVGCVDFDLAGYSPLQAEHKEA